jgi:hypothetical protein
MDTLVRARRSFRQYRDANIDPAMINRLLDAAAYAPTGVNYRQLAFTVVQDQAVLARVRDRLMAALADASAAGRLPPKATNVTNNILAGWREGRDVVFRGAPHLLIVSSPPDGPCAQQDVVIALSYFELLAQSAGLGTWLVLRAPPPWHLCDCPGRRTQGHAAPQVVALPLGQMTGAPSAQATMSQACVPAPPAEQNTTHDAPGLHVVWQGEVAQVKVHVLSSPQTHWPLAHVPEQSLCAAQVTWQGGD